MKYGRRRTYFKQIESTALTDIVFLLLIFFLLTSSFVTQTGINITLPGVTKAPANQLKNQLSVSINDRLQIFLNDQLIAKDDLLAALREKLQQNTEGTVVFRPDKSIKVQQLIEVMDIANQAGGKRLIIATKVQDRETDE